MAEGQGGRGRHETGGRWRAASWCWGVAADPHACVGQTKDGAERVRGLASSHTVTCIFLSYYVHGDMALRRALSGRDSGALLGPNIVRGHHLAGPNNRAHPLTNAINGSPCETDQA